MGISDSIPARLVLWILTFTGFAINYMVGSNINIAMLAMVREPPMGSAYQAGVPECEDDTNFTVDLKSITVDEFYQEGNLSPVFDWNENEQNLIFGAYFWTMWITQLPGGILAQKYGGKKIFGLMQLLSILPNFLIPYSTTWGYKGLILIRLIQGFFNGFTWPSMNPLISQWVPPDERGKFMSAYLGSSFGAAVIFPLYAMLMSWYGWEAVFYFTGVVGLVWFFCWCLLIFESPRQHPRISESELIYIEKTLGETLQNKKNYPTPWLKIITSVPVWICTFSQFGMNWCLFTLINQTPTYFKFIHGFDIQMTGILSGIPQLSRSIFSIIYSVFSDLLMKKNIFGPTAVRKIASFVGLVLAGLCMLGLAFMGCNSTGAIFLLTICTALNGATSSGTFATTVDLSPNFSGVVFGIVATIGMFPGFITTALVGFLTNENQTSSQWQIIFIIGAGIQLLTGFIFIVFGTSETQIWNTPPKSQDQTDSSTERNQNLRHLQATVEKKDISTKL